MRNKSNRTPIIYIGLVLVLAILVSKLGRQVPEAKTFTITEFVQNLNDDKVAELNKQGSKYQGVLKSGEEFSFYKT